MFIENAVWYNAENRFALIEPNNGSPRYLVQLSFEQAITAPLLEGQRFGASPAGRRKRHLRVVFVAPTHLAVGFDIPLNQA